MKVTKKLLLLSPLIVLVLVTTFVLSSCDNITFTNAHSNDDTNESSKICQHQWIQADCLYPKTCRLCNETQGTALGHNFIEATCTQPKTCARCNLKEGNATGHTEIVDKSVSPTCTEVGLTEGKHCSVCNEVLLAQIEIKATGHKWNMSTCITPKTCPVCKITEGEPNGHTFENGECIYCYEEDPDYTKLTLTSTTYNIYLEDESDVAYITMIGAEKIWYHIDNTNIATCEWGEWDGYTIPLKFKPVASGKTHVIVYPEGYDEKIIIYITVNKPTPADLTTLTIEGVGKEFKQYDTGLPNTNKLHSATYKIDNYINDTISIQVSCIVSCTEYVDYKIHYIKIRYNLYNSNGVVVETGTTFTEFTHTHTQYTSTILFSNLPIDDYKLVFSDKY